MSALETAIRKLLERAVVRARDVAEAGARAALHTLAVAEERSHSTMSDEQRRLREALRAKAKNLGEGDREAGYPPLIEEIAYEQWHRLLFARFLAENGLLMYGPGMPVTLAECAELAPSEGADNGWDLAGRYAARMLPGIFRADDPAAQVRLAREHRAALEALVADLPREVFTSDDGLGWTYQFWQAKRKTEVNASGVKIGARELAPVTQLFTEDYMVRFLLENSLGAWWAARHPQSPLLAELAYLRFADDGAPAAGSFPGWPATAAEVTVMDPCCGSGHFLTRAFHLLRAMRMEEEGLDPAAAGDAVLRDNLFGLELDERCVQIAAFAVALEAWKSGGYRALPAPQVACSGVPVAGQLEDWLKLAGEDVNLRETLRELYGLFQEAPSLGSIISPQKTQQSRGMFAPEWEMTDRALRHGLAINNEGAEQATTGASDAAHAASLISGTYTLVTTNVPYLGRTKQSDILATFLSKHYPEGQDDLATAFLQRCLDYSTPSGSVAVVVPAGWLTLTSYKQLRKLLLNSVAFRVLVPLGEEAWQSFGIRGPRTALFIADSRPATPVEEFVGIDVSTPPGRPPIDIGEKMEMMLSGRLSQISQLAQHRNPDSRVTIAAIQDLPLLSQFADGLQGIATADYPRFGRCFWEVKLPACGWAYQQSTFEQTMPHAGRDHLLWWQDGRGELASFSQARVQGLAGLGKRGVAVAQMRHLPVTLYAGDTFDNNTAVILPKDPGHLSAIWAFCSSPAFYDEVRKIDSALKVTNATLVKVPFDLAHWQRVAAEQYPDGLPAPHSDDPTQWLFQGHPNGSDAPLHVAVARLLGYRWPEQPEADGLEPFADADGIVPLAPVRGETPAADRLRALLAAAYGPAWTPALQERLLAEAGFAGRDLAAWLADGKGFFAQHAKLFHNRPFIWHIWDGARDGFAVLVNAHQLTRGNLEKLIYTYLGDWITRQEHARDSGDPTAETRLIKARELKAKLELILTGEPPYDLYIRWKPLHAQPIGWEPDLNDGVRLNIRPFVAAGILRAKFSVNWNKDRGDNPPGSSARQYAAAAQQAATNRKDLPTDDGRERFNDLHLTRAVKENGRRG